VDPPSRPQQNLMARKRRIPQYPEHHRHTPKGSHKKLTTLRMYKLLNTPQLLQQDHNPRRRYFHWCYLQLPDL